MLSLVWFSLLLSRCSGVLVIPSEGALQSVLHPIVPASSRFDNSSFMAVSELTITGSVEFCVQLDLTFFKILQVNLACSGKITGPNMAEEPKKGVALKLKFDGMFGIGVSIGLPSVAIASVYYQRNSELEVEFGDIMSDDYGDKKVSTRFRYIKAVGLAIGDWAVSKARRIFGRLLGDPSKQKAKIAALKAAKTRCVYEAYNPPILDPKEEAAKGWQQKQDDKEKSIEKEMPKVKQLFDKQMLKFVNALHAALTTAKPTLVALAPKAFWPKYNELVYTTFKTNFYVAMKGAAWDVKAGKILCQQLLKPKAAPSADEALSALVNLFMCRIMSRGLLLDDAKATGWTAVWDSTKTANRQKNTMDMMRKTMGRLMFNDHALAVGDPCRIDEKNQFAEIPAKPEQKFLSACLEKVIASVTPTTSPPAHGFGFGVEQLFASLTRHSSTYEETFTSIFGDNQSKRKALTRTLTTVFAVTASAGPGASNVGFCTPDDNILQLERKKETVEKLVNGQCDPKNCIAETTYEAKIQIMLPLTPSINFALFKKWALEPGWSHRKGIGGGIHVRWAKTTFTGDGAALKKVFEPQNAALFGIVLKAGQKMVDSLQALWTCAEKAKDFASFKVFYLCLTDGKPLSQSVPLADLYKAVTTGIECAKDVKKAVKDSKNCAAFKATDMGLFFDAMFTAVGLTLLNCIGTLGLEILSKLFSFVGETLMKLAPAKIEVTGKKYLEFDLDLNPTAGKGVFAVDMLDVTGLAAGFDGGAAAVAFGGYFSTNMHMEVKN